MKLVLEEDLKCFAASTLGFLQEDVPRQGQLKGLKDPKAFLWMILDEGTSISSLKLDDGKSSLK